MFNELNSLAAFMLVQDTGSTDKEMLPVIGKKSKANELKTLRYLKQLYVLDFAEEGFTALIAYWNRCTNAERRILALIAAIRTDELLRESIEVVLTIEPGRKVPVEAFENHLIKLHPHKYSNATLHSTAQNLASSWKQAGFIEGKVKNIRKQPEVTHRIVAFAMHLGYLDGRRGDYLVNSPFVVCLGLNQEQLHNLLYEATKRDLIKYQNSGGVLVIGIPELNE